MTRCLLIFVAVFAFVPFASANDVSRSTALSAALSMPVWVGDKEQGRVSGGLGFGEGGEAAVGAAGAVKLNDNWALVGGAAMNTDGEDWGAKVGASVGW